MNQSYFQSQDFKRTSGQMSDTGLKFLFKWLGIGIKSIASFIKMLISSLLGK